MAGSMDASGEGRTEVKAEWTTDEEASGDARGAPARVIRLPESGAGLSACSARGRTRLAPPAAAGIFWWASVGLGKG